MLSRLTLTSYKSSELAITIVVPICSNPEHCLKQPVDCSCAVSLVTFGSRIQGIRDVSRSTSFRTPRKSGVPHLDMAVHRTCSFAIKHCTFKPAHGRCVFL